MPDFNAVQWSLAVLAAILTGVSKTGVPGTGMLVVPLMANLFGSRLSVGALLPMLIVADLFAVLWYREHCRWDQIRRLSPWVAFGLVLGAAFLLSIGETAGKDVLNPTIGGIVLAMLAVHLLRKRTGDRLNLRSKPAIAGAGTLAGFTTTVSNAAGPVMTIYVTAQGLTKNEFMGTFAWYFFLINSAKVPILLAISLAQPSNPLMTSATGIFNLIVVPAIIGGAFLGKWLLPRIPQRAFEAVILTLAAIASAKLLVS
ncbi:MAG: sulfite exporter TauE/SafE family protein [Fimbriimonadaceae bacterium]|nr:sulfite exporter TauE/SafE family protein [Fimbriimonadaceae bacterium]